MSSLGLALVEKQPQQGGRVVVALTSTEVLSAVRARSGSYR